MIQIQFNTQDVIGAMEDARDNYRASLEEGFAEAGRMVVDLFRQEWLSGRDGGGLGLNIQTGVLNQSVKSLTVVDGDKLTSIVYNRGAKYWEYHENPQGGRPQYLHLEEAFQEDGEKLYLSQVEMAMRQLA